MRRWLKGIRSFDVPVRRVAPRWLPFLVLCVMGIGAFLPALPQTRKEYIRLGGRVIAIETTAPPPPASTLSFSTRGASVNARGTSGTQLVTMTLTSKSCKDVVPTLVTFDTMALADVSPVAGIAA